MTRLAHTGDILMAVGCPRCGWAVLVELDAVEGYLTGTCTDKVRRGQPLSALCGTPLELTGRAARLIVSGDGRPEPYEERLEEL